LELRSRRWALAVEIDLQPTGIELSWVELVQGFVCRGSLVRTWSLDLLADWEPDLFDIDRERRTKCRVVVSCFLRIGVLREKFGKSLIV